MGVRPLFTRQSHPRGVLRCDCSYTHDCSQGLSAELSSSYDILSFPQIQASGQRIEYFEKLQLQCKFNQPLRIPLHSNIRWGSAQRMLERSYKLRKVCSIYFVLRPALTCYMFSRSTCSSNQPTPCMAPSRQSAVMAASKKRFHGLRLPSQKGIGSG